MENNRLLSLVVPVYFEEECIQQFIDETQSVLKKHDIRHEYVFVDDGSTDRTIDIIHDNIKNKIPITLVEFSYNHGKQAAVSAGIQHAKGDLLIYMDPDLQDPPLEIPRLINEIEKGYDLVFGVRREKKDAFINVIFSKIFWGVLNKFTGLAIPKGLAVMRIFNRKFANEFLLYKEQNRFIEGIFIKIGLKNTTLEIAQRERFAGKTKFNFRKKMDLAFNAILDFSELPLKIMTKIGFLLTCLGIIAMLSIIGIRLFWIDFQMGWPSLMCMLLIGFGCQLFFMGIVASYIGKIYKEVKHRPLFSIRNISKYHE